MQDSGQAAAVPCFQIDASPLFANGRCFFVFAQISHGAAFLRARAGYKKLGPLFRRLIRSTFRGIPPQPVVAQ
jgi:hypothetical protein